MPSTIGLGHARQGAWGGAQICTSRLLLNGDGDLTLPAGLLAQAGLEAGDDLFCETGPEGLRLTSDRLRKVYVEITSACNLACATCIRQTWDEPLGHMPLARYMQLLDGLPAGAQSPGHPVTLSLSGFGEPLVHPEFLACVRLAREQGVRVEVITNGTRLDAALARELVALGVAQVTVSIDGGDEVAYAAMRGRRLSRLWRRWLRRGGGRDEGWRSAWRSWRPGAISAVCRGYWRWRTIGNWTSCR